MAKFTYDEMIESLLRAKNEAPKDLDKFLNMDSSFDLHLFELEMWEMNVTPEKSMGDRLGIKLESFPMTAELEEDEIKAIVDKIIEVFALHHCIPDLPVGLPCRIAYEALQSIWNDPVTIFASGHFHFDFCSLDLDQHIKN